MRNLMVIGEIAVALVVLAGAGLLVRSFIRLMAVDTGFNPDSVLTLRVAPAWIAVPEGTDEDEFFRQLSLERERADVFYQQLVEQIAALPGVESCAAINRLPLTGNWWQTTFAIEDQPVATRQDMFKCNSRVITPGYFETMQVALLEGRDLDARDRADAPRSVIVNQEVARRYFAGASPLGKRISFESPDEGRVAWFAIVGVAADERDQSLEVEPHPMIYVPFAQARFGHFGDWGMSLVVRTHSDPMASVGSVREAVQGLDRNLPVAEVRTMSQLVARSAAGQRFNMLLLVFFAATALLLASVGVYVVIAQTVSQRTREIGIRVALGAQRRDVMRMVMKQGLATTLLGVAIGLAAAFALTRVMSTLLFEVSATDPLTFGSIGALLIGVSLFACMIPARRATKVDPMVALRYE
jgi:putative ABC transport system permease protein